MQNQKPKSREHILRDWEIEIILDEVESFREEFIVKASLGLATRISETTHIRLQDIDFANSEIILKDGYFCGCAYCMRAEYSKDWKKQGYYYMKSNRKKNSTEHQRVIGMSPEIKKLFQYYFKPYKIGDEKIRRESVIDMYYSPNGAYQVVHRLYQRILDKEEENPSRRKLQHKLFPHCLRATAIRLILAKMRNEYGSADAYALSSIAGWKDIKTSMIYISDEYGREIMKKSL